jgi:hypothetical protein
MTGQVFGVFFFLLDQQKTLLVLLYSCNSLLNVSIRKGEKRSSEKAVNSTLKNYVHLLFCLYICNGFCFSLFFSMRIRQKLFCFLIKVCTQVRLIFIFFQKWPKMCMDKILWICTNFLSNLHIHLHSSGFFCMFFCS